MRSSWCLAVLLLLSITSPSQARIWSDQTGQQRIEAEFISLDGAAAKFRLPDGKLRQCELAHLGPEDQALIATLVAGTSPAKAPEVVQTAAVEKPAAAETRTAAANAQPCAPAAPTYECTVMVPEMVTVMRTITVCEWRDEQRQSTYMACRMVPETRQVNYQYTVPTYETRTREFVYSVFKPVQSSFQRDYTVMVPHKEKRQAVRRECQMVPVEMTRTVCEDHGCWQQIVRHSGCGGCGSCSTACNVWVPKVERREVKYTVLRPQFNDVPYECEVVVCKPERRTETVQVCNYVAEPQKRSVPYTVCVPVTKTGTREVTCYRMVQEPRTQTCTVRVPYQVQKQVPVQVCQMVAKKVTMQAPACGPSGCWRGNRCW